MTSSPSHSAAETLPAPIFLARGLTKVYRRSTPRSWAALLPASA
jgi:hypothetical protein